MNRKIRIAAALGLALASIVSAFAPLAASATPLLSGYGGPGAGEQAIVGSTLLGGARGGGSSGGSSRSSGAGGSGAGGNGATGVGGSTSGSTSRGGSGGSTSGSASRGGSGGRASHGGEPSAGSSRAGGARAASGEGAGEGSVVGAHVYPRSTSSDSGLIGISGGDVLPLVGVVVALALIGVFTLRFVRLQP